MFKRITMASVLAFSVTASGAAFAQAPTASAAATKAAKPATKAQKTAVVKVPKGKLLIDNHRDSTLTELSLQPAGANAGTEPTVVAKQLEAGKKITIALPAKSGCVFNVNGTFEDESTLDVPERDLCKDPVITLVE